MRDAPKAVRMSNYKDIKSKPEFFEFGAEIEVLGLSLCTTATITTYTGWLNHQQELGCLKLGGH